MQSCIIPFTPIRWSRLLVTIIGNLATLAAQGLDFDGQPNFGALHVDFVAAAIAVAAVLA